MTDTLIVPETLRQTLLSRHDKCPYSAMLEMKYPNREAHALTRGTVFHLVRQHCVETIVENEERSIPGEMATEIADGLMAEHPEWCLSTQEQDVVRLCSYNWAESYVHDPETFVGVEIPMRVEIAGWTVTGTIDQLDAQNGTFYIHDGKSSLAIKKRDEMRRDFQGQLYMLLAMFGVHAETGLPMGAGIDHGWFYNEFARYRTEEGGIVEGEADWSRAEIFQFKRSLERNLLAFEESMKTGNWPARDGSWCSTCVAQAECPIPESLRELPEITDEETARRAFSKKLANERESRRIQSGLRGWVQEHGPIFVGDLAFDAQVSDVRKVKDWDILVRAIEWARDDPEHREFVLSEHVDFHKQTKFAKRKATEEEMIDVS